MQRAPSLFSLCATAVATRVTNGNDGADEIFQLPSHFFEMVVMNMPPVALHTLHEKLYCRRGFTSTRLSSGNKRGRSEVFSIAWKESIKKRWPEDSFTIMQDSEHLCQLEEFDDGQQIYWEKHLQNCLDKAVESALLPSFDGNIGKLVVPDDIMKSIGLMGSKLNDSSKLVYHCSKFACYARCLKLRNILCVPETCDLLRTGKLQALVLRGISTNNHVAGVCMLLRQNLESLLSLEFVCCRFSSSSLDKIFASINNDASQSHGIQHLAVKSSLMFDNSLPLMATAFLSFLSSGRSLKSLHFCDTRLDPRIAKAIFTALLGSPCELTTLEISDQTIASWLSKVERELAGSLLLSSLFMKSLTVLNLRGNYLCKNDAEDLCHVLVHMSSLRSLDISDNPIGDHGLRNLIPYFTEALGKTHHLSDLKMANCNFSYIGVSQLLRKLPSLKRALGLLSLAENHLGSSIAVDLAEFLETAHVKELNVEDIGLGAMGFQILEEKIQREIAVAYINISKNSGGMFAAYFISKVIREARELVAINAGYNCLPPESSIVLYNSLKSSRGKLERLDLTGNIRLHESNYSSKLLEFRHLGNPIVLITQASASPYTTPYDDDP